MSCKWVGKLVLVLQMVVNQMGNSRGSEEKKEWAIFCRKGRYGQKMKKKNIVVAVTNDLVTDQRVHRSCMALVEAGYGVTLVGRRLPESLSLGHGEYDTRRMRLLFRRSALFYAEYNIRLMLHLLFARADAFYANDSDTLLACCWAARLRKKRLIFDAHELFPEVPELVGKPRVRRVWQWVERHCLPQVDAAFTVCESVAKEYERRYGVNMTVVRNLPDWKPEENYAIAPHGKPWMILYQGAVNVGRGVRELIDAMEFLPDCRLVVAGDGDQKDALESYSNSRTWRERIAFMGRVRPEELHTLTQKADLGVCLLEDMGLNYRYSLPNRIADFAHAGVPILATDFYEISRVINTYRTGTTVGPCPKEKTGAAYQDYVTRLAKAIDNTILYWNTLPRKEREQRFVKARKELNWESEKKLLKERIDAII